MIVAEVPDQFTLRITGIPRPGSATCSGGKPTRSESSSPTALHSRIGQPPNPPRKHDDRLTPSVVNLKFLSHRWHARGRNYKFENHTRNINLLVQLLNPKFAQRFAPT